MTKAKTPDGAPRERRHFTAEFKLEAVRRAEERRAAGVPLTQVARELGVTDDLLRGWRQQARERAGAPPADVFPGAGRLPAEADEVRRLTRVRAGAGAAGDRLPKIGGGVRARTFARASR